MTPQRSKFAAAVSGVQFESIANAIKTVGVWPVLVFALAYILWFSMRPLGEKIDAHALKTDILLQHLKEEGTTHTQTITILKQMCVMQANTPQERRDCLK